METIGYIDFDGEKTEIVGYNHTTFRTLSGQGKHPVSNLSESNVQHGCFEIQKPINEVSCILLESLKKKETKDLKIYLTNEAEDAAAPYWTVEVGKAWVAQVSMNAMAGSRIETVQFGWTTMDYSYSGVDNEDNAKDGSGNFDLKESTAQGGL